MRFQLSKFCIYTIRHSDALSKDYRSGGSGRFSERVSWTTGCRLLREAREDGVRLPVCFAPAENDISGGVTGWALIDDIKLTPSGTTVEFSSLQPLSKRRPLTSFKKLSDGKPLSKWYIRPYVPAWTPDFLRELSSPDATNYWILKANPRYNEPFESWMCPGETIRWIADRTPPQKFSKDDRLVIWQSGHGFRVIALGYVKEPNLDKDRRFKVTFSTGVLEDTPDIVALRKLPLFKGAAFLKRGPVSTLYPLSPEQGEYLYRLTDPTLGAVKSIERVNADLAARVARARRDSSAERRKRLARAPKIPARHYALTTVFERNEDVIAEVLEQARGICGGCRKAAPFLRKTTGKPYLEVHHKTPLAQGGLDTVENAIALCPNCHRNEHHGVPKLRRTSRPKKPA